MCLRCQYLLCESGVVQLTRKVTYVGVIRFRRVDCTIATNTTHKHRYVIGFGIHVWEMDEVDWYVSDLLSLCDKCMRTYKL